MTLLAIALAILPAPAQPPAPYWTKLNGCTHGHRAQVATGALERLLRNHRPMTPHALELAGHLRRCTTTRDGRRRTERRARRLRAWRRSYAHRWPITFHRLPGWAQGWAVSTGACESGNDPAKETGNGYVGAFQFLPSTWYAAGGQGWPSAHSWHYQAVIAVRLMLREGAHHWPVCGR